MRHHWMFNPVLLAVTLLAPGLLVACRPLPAARAQATHHVTVIEGSGGGDYAPGDTVRIEPYRMPDTCLLYTSGMKASSRCVYGIISCRLRHHQADLMP